ncbi:polysaccharide deacetylase family protein [Streptomyces coelicoflavus]|uniref:polysaccharide deacetylase family protein n=1 Tax=Streptomyces coelicoflavus TaxID=285562 RepID=UPI00210A0101|nr:polysaccharide deacetylase family protein [Streptomyces coelicoflavus]MCQ4200694.1 polysaccharide deacetylase family protein [Streptomyces coelicoflavus]
MRRDGPHGNRSRRTGKGRLLLRTALGLLAVAVVALPFTVAWQYDALRRTVAAQAAPPASAGAGAGADAKAAPAGSAPVVLAYHDIGPDGRSRYTVSLKNFDAQLRALRDAGYRTLSTEEFTDFLRSGRAPGPRTVYLTFDDGTHGLWTHADPVLAKYGMKAAAYLITGQVGTHRPYYLSWAEIERMARSGRWDFQAHTHLSHERAAVDAAGHERSAFTNRLWRADEGRVETSGEYRRRIAADLGRSVRDLVAHDLPRPRLFAYPFSERLDESNLGADDAEALRSLLRKRFAATLTNSAARPLPAGPRAAAAGQVQRLEITRDTTPAGLLRELARWAPVAPKDADRPLSRQAHWETTGDTGPAGPGVLTGDSRPPAGTDYVSADYRPLATADWTHYRLRAGADGLHGTSNSVGITVRAGSEHPVALSVGRNTASLTSGGPQGTGERRTCRLEPSATHRITVSVTPRQVRMSVDGDPCTAVRAGRWRVAEGAGGFSLGVRNDGPEQRWPRFTSLKVE